MNIIKEINYLHLLLAFLGMIIHILIEYSSVKRKNKVWSFGYWLHDNIFNTILSVIIIITIIVANTDGSVQELIPVTNITAVFLGYGSQSFFKNLLKFYKK